MIFFEIETGKKNFLKKILEKKINKKFQKSFFNHKIEFSCLFFMKKKYHINFERCSELFGDVVEKFGFFCSAKNGKLLTQYFCFCKKKVAILLNTTKAFFQWKEIAKILFQ